MIRLYGDPILRQTAQRVENIDGAIMRDVQNMVAGLRNSPNGIAIAAPQVGISKQIFLHTLQETPTTLINPTIVETSGTSHYREGCLSLPGLACDIARPSEIVIVGLDLNGNEIHRELGGLEARVAQHEIDHLNGVLMIDLLDEDQKTALEIV